MSHHVFGRPCVAASSQMRHKPSNSLQARAESDPQELRCFTVFIMLNNRPRGVGQWLHTTHERQFTVPGHTENLCRHASEVLVLLGGEFITQDIALAQTTHSLLSDQGPALYFTGLTFIALRFMWGIQIPYLNINFYYLCSLFFFWKIPLMDYTHTRERALTHIIYLWFFASLIFKFKIIFLNFQWQ